MTGARTPGRTHGAVPAVFVSRSAEIRAARRSRRRTASSPASGAARPAPAVPAAYRVFFCRVRTVSPLAVPAGVRRLSEPDGSNPPLRVSTGCGVFGEWAGNGCGNAGRTNCVPCAGSAEQKRSPTPRGGRENAPNFPFHPFSASGEIIPIGERPPSLSF